MVPKKKLFDHFTIFRNSLISGQAHITKRMIENVRISARRISDGHVSSLISFAETSSRSQSFLDVSKNKKMRPAISQVISSDRCGDKSFTLVDSARR
jgi:hypothetical protein